MIKNNAINIASEQKQSMNCWFVWIVENFNAISVLNYIYNKNVSNTHTHVGV